MLSEPEGPSPQLGDVRLTTRVSLDGDGGQFTTASGISSISANGTRVEYQRPLPERRASSPLRVRRPRHDKGVAGSGGVRYNTLAVSDLVPRIGRARQRGDYPRHRPRQPRPGA